MSVSSAVLPGASKRTITDAIRLEQLTDAFQCLRQTLPLAAASAAGAAIFAWGILSSRFLIAWFLCVIATYAALSVFAAWIKRKSATGKFSPARSLDLMAFSAVLPGFVWALLPLAIRDLSGDKPILLIIMIVVIAGSSSMRTRSYAKTAIIFVSPVLLAVSVKLFLQSEAHLNAVSAMVVFYYCFIIRASADNERAYIALVRHKQQLAAQLDSTRLFETAMEKAPFGAFIATSDATVIKVNSALCKMLECTEDEIRLAKEGGRNKFLHAEDAKTVREHYSRLLRGNCDKVSFEARFLASSGRSFWVYSEGTLLRDDNTGAPKYIIGQVRNIDARKRAEAELRRIAKQKNAAVEAAGLGEAVTYYRSTCSHGVMQEIGTVRNAQFCEIVGVDPGDGVCSVNALLSSVHPDDRERVLSAQTDAQHHEGGAFSVNCRILRPSDEVRHAKINFSVYREDNEECKVSVCVLADVTEQVEARKELERALERKKLAANLAGLGELRFVAEADCFELDEEAYDILAIDRKQLPKLSRRNWTECIHPDDRERVLRIVSGFWARPNYPTGETINYRIVRPNGEVRHVKTKGMHFYDENGDLESALIAFLDVTKEVELARALEAEKSELRKSHDLRRLAINVANLGEFHRDLRSTQVEWSTRLYELAGVSPTTFDCSVEAVTASLHPDDVRCVEEELYRISAAFAENAKLQNKFSKQKFRIVRPSGEVRYVSAHSYFQRVGPEPDAVIVRGLVRDETNEVVLRQSLEKEKSELSNAVLRANLAIELAELGVFEFDADKDKMNWDARLREIFGKSPTADKSDEKFWLKAVHADDRDKVVDVLEKAKSKPGPRSIRIECRIIRPTGEMRHLRVAGRATYDSAGSMVSAFAVVWDVTEQVELLENVERERSLLETTLTAVGDGVIRLSPRGRIEYMNRAACEFAGVTCGKDAVGKPFVSEFNIPGTLPAAGTLVGEACDKCDGNPANPLCRVRNLSTSFACDGDVLRDFELSAEPMFSASDECWGQVVVLHDTTELKQSRAAASESKELLRVALDHAPVGLSVIDRDGNCSFVNEAFAAVLGLSVELMLSRPIEEFISLQDVRFGGRVNSQDASAFDSNEGVFEQKVIRPSGAEIRLQINIRRIRDAKGSISFSVMQALDLTYERRRLEELHEAKELSQVTISSASEGIVRTDEKGVITLCNPVAARLLEVSEDTLVGRRFADVFKFAIGTREMDIEDPVSVVLKRGESVRINSRLLLKSNSSAFHRVNLSIAPMADSNESVVGAVVLIQDATEIAQLTERLTKQAYTDELTGIGNRRAFEERLEERIRCNRRRGADDYLLFIDLDHFKVINDVCGHSAGDQLLCDISELFLSKLRESDFLARIGGDEFGVILLSANEENARSIAENMIQAVSDYRLNYDMQSFQVGASIGVTRIDVGADAPTLMIEADTACYTAKSTGRGRVCVFSANDEAIVETRNSQDWHNRILQAIEERRFKVFLQRIVSKEQVTLGFEALIRLQEGEKIFTPGDFINTARRHNLARKLDRLVFENIIEVLDVAVKSNSVIADKYISVNLGASTIADQAFREWMSETLDDHGSVTERLWVELTESDRMKWTDCEIEFLRSLRSRGVRLYLDDFGTGYNSFDVLKKIEVDGLKLDRSVIRNIVVNPIDQALILASLNIAQRLDLDIVAEGVEDRDGFDFLSSLGIKKFQGYFFHKPELASKLLAEQNSLPKKKRVRA